ncbi:MAG: tetratricopeptide repeat protein [Chloroflexi bacterium]|jgi:Tol biopolymer transport system component/Flp pilus assembly protein TadD|nr:tetratricopeptide repeat protein [Chloroflexota bacterium]
MTRSIRKLMTLTVLALLMGAFLGVSIVAAQTDEPQLTPDEYIERGLDFIEQGELQLAAAEFQAALELAPENTDALNNLGLVYIDLGLYEQANKLFETVLTNNPDDLIANGGKCAALAFIQPLQGEVQCREVIKANPQNSDAINSLGIALVLQNKTEDAIIAFQTAIELAPQHKWAHNNLGRTYLDLGDYEQAISELSTAIKINPENDLAYYNLGLAYARQSDYQAAIPYYEQAIQLNPNKTGAYFDLGIIYQELGQTEQAIAALFRYLQLAPEDPNRAEIEAMLAEMGGPVPSVFVRAKIAFVSDRDGNMEIYSMNTDGSELTRLTDDPAYDVGPMYSPDGMRILFASDRNGNFDIYSMNTDGTDVVQLTDDPGNDSMPAWSADGNLIAFVSDRSGKLGIYIMNADGSEQTATLVNESFTIYAPTWSPEVDAQSLAMVTDAQGAYDLYVIHGATNESGKLTQDLGDVLTPDWSPNGRFIVFAANPFESYDLFIIRPDGSDLGQVTNNDVAEYKPRWSPDSNYIIYSVGLNDASEIEILNESGDVMRLTQNDVFDGMPTWGPMDQ